MRYSSLPPRELIADCVETMIEAHCFDAMVCIPNCDKIVPGMLMAAVRVNIPAIFVSGGPMAGRTPDGTVVDLISVFEGVGALKAGILTRPAEHARTARLPFVWFVLKACSRPQHELPHGGSGSGASL